MVSRSRCDVHPSLIAHSNTCNFTILLPPPSVSIQARYSSMELTPYHTNIMVRSTSTEQHQHTHYAPPPPFPCALHNIKKTQGRGATHGSLHHAPSTAFSRVIMVGLANQFHRLRSTAALLDLQITGGWPRGVRVVQRGPLGGHAQAVLVVGLGRRNR